VDVPGLESLPEVLTWTTRSPDSGVMTVQPFWSETDNSRRPSSDSGANAPRSAPADRPAQAAAASGVVARAAGPVVAPSVAARDEF
jgi:hypothetical protein